MGIAYVDDGKVSKAGATGEALWVWSTNIDLGLKCSARLLFWIVLMTMSIK